MSRDDSLAEAKRAARMRLDDAVREVDRTEAKVKQLGKQPSTRFSQEYESADGDYHEAIDRYIGARDHAAALDEA